MKLRQNPVFPLHVFYDGSCPFCSREIAYYRRLDRHRRLCFVDISAPSFDAGAWDLNRQEIFKVIHVRDAGGRLYRGVDAFRVLWLGLPNPLYRRMSRLFGLPGLHWLAAVGYRVFARLRHLLSSCFVRRG